MATERDYKRRIRQIIGGWSDTYEPTRGSGFGQPDLQFLVGGRLVPVEVKVGEVRNGLLKPKAIRPSQISWHHRFHEAGGVSFIVVCFGPLVEFDAWAIPSVKRDVTSAWRQGWELKRCRVLIFQGKLLVDLSSLVLELIE